MICNHNQAFLMSEYIKPATNEIIQVIVSIPKKKFNLKCNVQLIKSTQVLWLYDKVNTMQTRQHYTRSPLSSNSPLKTFVSCDHLKIPAQGEVRGLSISLFNNFSEVHPRYMFYKLPYQLRASSYIYTNMILVITNY